MKIPKKFKLFGHTITVEYDNSLMETDDRDGLALYREGKIKLLPNEGIYKNKPNSHIEATFLHEYLHFAFTFLGEHEISANEKLIDRLSQLLYQFIETQEGELK